MRVPSPLSVALTLVLLFSDAPKKGDISRFVVLAQEDDAGVGVGSATSDDEDEGGLPVGASDVEDDDISADDIQSSPEQPNVFGDDILQDGTPQSFEWPKKMTDDEINDLDKDTPYPKKQLKMGACLDLTRRHLHDHKETMKAEVEKTLKEDKTVTEQQIISTMVHYFMVACYFNIDIPTAETSRKDINNIKEDELVKLVNLQPNKPMQFSKKLEGILTDIASKDQDIAQTAKQEGLNPDMSKTSAWTKYSKYIYLIVVLSSGFALAIIALLKLTRNEHMTKQKFKPSKAEKKAMKGGKQR